MELARLVGVLVQFYIYLIVAYVLMSWFPLSGILEEIYGAIAAIVEPYLGLFRRIIPPLGPIDISPIIAIVVLQFASGALVRVLAGL